MTNQNQSAISLGGRVVLITGSVGGIGWRLAEAFADAGTLVMLHGWGDPAEIEEASTLIRKAHEGRVELIKASVSIGEEMADVVRTAHTKWGAIDILINDAGVTDTLPITQSPFDRWRKIQETILNRSYHSIRTAVPLMKKRGWGRILQLAPSPGPVGSHLETAYFSAKYALMGLIKSVAFETAECGITCNAICPGNVRTPSIDSKIREQARIQATSEDRVIGDVILANQLAKRFVTVEEIAALAVYLCTESARSITGTSIPIDGGWGAR